MGKMANRKLQETGRQEGTTEALSEPRNGPGVSEVAEPVVINWQVMAVLLIQMQEDMQALQDALGNTITGKGKTALKRLERGADELLPKLIAEARRQ
jgi:hypothetical protein